MIENQGFMISVNAQDLQQAKDVIVLEDGIFTFDYGELILTYYILLLYGYFMETHKEAIIEVQFDPSDIPGDWESMSIGDLANLPWAEYYVHTEEVV